MATETLGWLREQSNEKRAMWDWAGSVEDEGESNLRPERSKRPWRRWGRLSEGEEISEGELEGEGGRLPALLEEPRLQRILCLSLGMLPIELGLGFQRVKRLTGTCVGRIFKKTVADMQEPEREI